MDYTNGPRCGIENCKSKRYYYEDGLKFCKNGHQQEGQITQADDDDFTASQGRKTRLKKEAQEKKSTVYSGQEALELYLQCYQLILRKQCYALIHTVGLSPELETAVKDLWALRLQLLRDRFSEPDSDMNFSSQPESDTDAERNNKKWSREWKVKDKQMPNLIESIGLCYLGTVLLRLPVSLGEIYRWAIKEDIPFIRVIRLVPHVMKRKLPSHYQQMLDTQSVLEPDRLRRSIHELVLIYNHRFKIEFPPLNYSLLLFKHVRDLALPLQIYDAVRQISNLLQINFSFPRPGSRQKALSWPELQIMALIVVAVKLFHPFDFLDRHPNTETDPGVLSIDWEIWNESQAKYGTQICPPEKIGRGNEISVTEHDIMNMSDEKLDEYLDWSEKTWVDENREPKKHDLPKQLLDMFPTGRLDGSPQVQTNFGEEAKMQGLFSYEKLKNVQKHLRMRKVISEKNEGESQNIIRRIGSFYKRYRNVEDLPPQAELFYETAASLISTSKSVLVQAVYRTEGNLQLWRAKQLKEEKMEDGENGDPMDDTEGIGEDEGFTREREFTVIYDESELSEGSADRKKISHSDRGSLDDVSV